MQVDLFVDQVQGDKQQKRILNNCFLKGGVVTCHTGIVNPYYKQAINMNKVKIKSIILNEAPCQDIYIYFFN